MLVCVGDLLEDVLVRLPGDPRRGRDTLVRSARVRGGSAANVAALDAEQGGSPRFVGQVGDDTLGQTLTDDLLRRGVELVVRRVGGTGVVVTMVGPNGRSRLVDRGTAQRLSVIDPAVLDDAAQLYMAASAFTADPMATAVDQLIGEARDRRVAIVLGGPNQSEREDFGADAFVELVASARPDTVVLNRDEHSGLGLAPRQPMVGASTTVVTNGARPTLVITADGRSDSVAVPPVEHKRDRTGIGDGFLAGFLSSRRTGADPVSAAHAGHRIAAKVFANLGPTTGGL